LLHEEKLPLLWMGGSLGSTDNGGGVRGEEERVSEREEKVLCCVYEGGERMSNHKEGEGPFGLTPTDMRQWGHKKMH
jgi:hypothetical protein